MRRELEAAAASVASQILGCPISPSQWKAHRDRRYDTEYGQTWMVSEFWWAGAVIEGVGLTTSIWTLRGPNLPPHIFVGGLGGPTLTLASFGEALEARRAEREAAEGQR